MSTPSISSSRARRPALLVVGSGDVGLRVIRLLRGRWRVLALVRDPERVPLLRAAGAVPLRGDLDEADTLQRLGGLADAVLHLAPPPSGGRDDTRTAALIRALARGGRTSRLVYVSTSGVYGDCDGARVDETRAVAPRNDRAHRRAAAEARLRAWGRAGGVRVTLLRAPGIHALDRPHGDPRERVRRGTPVLDVPDDPHTNHIHADDLARACVAALFRGRAQRVLNVSDDTGLTLAAHLDAVADHAGLPRPPRIARAAAEGVLTPQQLSFLDESRRLDNARMKRELRLVLRYPTVVSSLPSNHLPNDPSR